jgi:quercetin dioxygenase-like cupin family protein
VQILGVPFQTVEWEAVPARPRPGTTGSSTERAVESGNIRLRLIEYSAGYAADHWCARGHVVLCLEGEITCELNDGRAIEIRAGQGFHVGDDDGQHRVLSRSGAKVYIVD